MRLILFCLFAVSTMAAQSLENPLDTFSKDPIPILVEPLRYPQTAPLELVQWVEQELYTTLEDHWHYQVVNHSSSANTGVVDPEYIFQLSLEPIVDQIIQSEQRDSMDRVIATFITIESGLQFNLRVTHIVTGELKYAKAVKSTLYMRGKKIYAAGGWGFLPPGSRDWRSLRMQALPTSPAQEEKILNAKKDLLFDQALQNLKKDWTAVLDRIFPVAKYLQAVVSGSTNKPTQVKVNVGSSTGMVKHAPWEFYTVKIYEALGETFVRKNVVAYFLPKEVGEDSTIGNVYGGKKELGTALASGNVVFCRPRTGWLYGTGEEY